MPTLNTYAGAAGGVSATEIVNLAQANIDTPWTADGCVMFTYAVSNLAGLPFFNRADYTIGGNPLSVRDVGLSVPHSWQKNVGGDGWELKWEGTSADGLRAAVKPGDIVRIYHDGNPTETWEKGDWGGTKGHWGAHSFIVETVSNGKVTVIDNWGGDINSHDLQDLIDYYAPNGSFQGAYVSRIDDKWVAESVGTNIGGIGFGDFSNIVVDLPGGGGTGPVASYSSGPNETVFIGEDGDHDIEGSASHTDAVTYAGLSAGITARLDSGQVVGNGTDTLTSIEDIIGTDHDDTIFGDNRANLLVGGLGRDRIFGNGGDDILVDDFAGTDKVSTSLSGGAGRDVLVPGYGNWDLLVGGSDADVFYFGDPGGRYRISDFEDGVDLIMIDVPDLQSPDLRISASSGGAFVAYDDWGIQIDGVAPDQLTAWDFAFV